MSRERKEKIRENDAEIKKTEKYRNENKCNVKTKRKGKKAGEEFQKLNENLMRKS